jgi:hypothetical protein
VPPFAPSARMAGAMDKGCGGDIGGGGRAADLVGDDGQAVAFAPSRSMVFTKFAPWAETTQEVRRIRWLPPGARMPAHPASFDRP